MVNTNSGFLFSHVKDFANIKHKASAAKLEEQLQEYTSALTLLITKDNGTIEKHYLDTILAKWHLTANPAELGYAALHLLRALIPLNRQWQLAGSSPFFTRLGLDITSNNKTDAATRAQIFSNLNHSYGTQILVSEAVYEQLKDQFVLRFIDRIKLNDSAESDAIYELLEEEIARVPFDVMSYNEHFKEAFANYEAQQWREAMHGFAECLMVYSQDTVAPVFLMRCDEFRKNPPAQWDKVWHLSQNNGSTL